MKTSHANLSPKQPPAVNQNNCHNRFRGARKIVEGSCFEANFLEIPPKGAREQLLYSDVNGNQYFSWDPT